MIPEERSKAEKIMLQALLVNDYLVTIKKAILADGQDIDGFVDHYSDLIQVALDTNWENHDLAESISRDDFRRNLKLD
ncbi:MAG: hypothetical protein AAFY16_08035 [Cyanobacteria bacterium J06642_3]